MAAEILKNNAIESKITLLEGKKKKKKKKKTLKLFS